jgi:hypothetical protein
MLTKDRLGVTGSTGEAPAIAGGKGGGAAAAAARAPVNAWCDGSMWASGKRLRGLGKALGGLAGSGEAQASELHGGDTMAEGGKGENRARAPTAPFKGGTTWRRVQDFPGG